MGCNSSTAKVASEITAIAKDDVTKLPNNGFTDKEKHAIKKTWRIMSKSLPSIGASIFLTIFNLKPVVKDLFPCRDAEGEDLLRDNNFRGHASRFMQAVGAAVDNIDHLDQAMAPLLFGLGQQHIHYQGFKVEYFDIFVEAILKVFESELGAKYNEDVSNAWRRVVEFIILKLKEGLLDAIAKHNSLKP